MRVTNKLCAQHIGWHFKKHWQVQGVRVPRETGAAAEVQRLGIQLKTVEDVVNPKRKFLREDFPSALSNINVEDKSHVNWHSIPCHAFDDDILLGGLPQAQVLTNSIEINTLPDLIEDSIASQQLPDAVNRNVQNAIIASNVLDAQQVKLPKVKLADRPAFNLPREYGICQERRNHLLLNKLLLEIEKLAGRSVSIRRKLIDNVDIKTSLSKDNDLIEFAVKADKVLTSARALDVIKGKFSGVLPDLFPLKCTISIPQKHVYTEENFYPLRKETRCSHPHIIFGFFNRETMCNLHGSAVTDIQFQGRTIMLAFSAAVARAKQLHNNNTSGTLPKPVVVQCVHTDGRKFDFGVFQLNTLNINTDADVKNYWFHRPSSDLFTECGYKSGRTYLEGYNNETFRILNALYHSS